MDNINSPHQLQMCTLWQKGTRVRPFQGAAESNLFKVRRPTRLSANLSEGGIAGSPPFNITELPISMDLKEKHMEEPPCYTDAQYSTMYNNNVPLTLGTSMLHQLYWLPEFRNTAQTGRN